MRLNDKLQISKQGVNLARSIVDNNNCFIHEIKQENDVGIDAIIEIADKGIMTGKNIAVQIKTGPSYINRTKNECSFPIGQHYSYWENHVLPVYGFVCDLEKNCFYYIDIKNYIEYFKEDIKRELVKSVKFDISFYSTINENNFTNLFINPFLHRVPFLDYEDAEKLVFTNNIDDISLGLNVLHKHYYMLERTWDIFLETFRDSKYSMFHNRIIDYFAAGTLNPDKWVEGNSYIVSSNIARDKILTFKKDDIIRLLGMVDEENGFQRGSMGEWIDFTIRLLPNKLKYLLEIINDEKIPMVNRENALFLLACYEKNTFISLPNKKTFECSNKLEEYIQKYGELNPYS